MTIPQYFNLLRRKATICILNFLLRCNGIPVLTEKRQFLGVKYLFCFLRKFSLFFVNMYLVYRIYKFFQHRNMTFDFFPMINAGVSACSVNSIVLQYKKFDKFSQNIHDVLQKYKTSLSGTAFLKLSVFYFLFVSYLVVCVIAFPSSASHWFDTADAIADTEDFLHSPSMKPITHATIFIMCSGSVVTSLMLYCFLCVYLQQLLHSIYTDLKNLQLQDTVEPQCMHQFRARFIETANVIQVTDDVFSFFGLVGLGCVFSRACACIHFYLNLRTSNYTVTWLFIITQILFDTSALTAVCCFAASVSEEAKKISPMVLLVNNRIPPKNITFHLQCLNFAKIVLSLDVQMTAWKLFPFSRRVLPTVIGVTLSYITVIIQMHHAASMNQVFSNSLVNVTQPLVKYFS